MIQWSSDQMVPGKGSSRIFTLFPFCFPRRLHISYDENLVEAKIRDEELDSFFISSSYLIALKSLILKSLAFQWIIESILNLIFYRIFKKTFLRFLMKYQILLISLSSCFTDLKILSGNVSFLGFSFPKIYI